MNEGEWWNLKDDIEAAMVKAGHAHDCSASGQCDDAVAAAMEDPTVKPLLDKIEEGNKWLLGALRETGAWEDSELRDHETNLSRFVWGIACDWRENKAEEERTAQRNASKQTRKNPL